jgi:alkanesulfonate monooxygenase SsuD/methylene tetrahydromethanopterin reductase-like flavin-dependent oxidoreductase (luciferase family)
VVSKTEIKPRFGLWYDFRKPIRWRLPFQEIYNEILDQIGWAENNGFDDVWLSEHHFIDDGYSPSLITIASAIAARTKRIRIGTSVLLLPLHHPLHLAEACATVDVISNGRFDFGIAVGYKVEEFEGFDISSKHRGGRTDEALEIISRLWEGKMLNFNGKYYKVNNVKITPEVIQKPRPPIWVGGFGEPAIKRTLRYGDGYMGGGGKSKDLYELYKKELENAGRPTDNLKFADCIPWLIASDDPEKTWNEAADHVIYQRNGYAEWMEKPGMSSKYLRVKDREELKHLGILNVVDPETCTKIIREYLGEVPVTNLRSWTIPPGLTAKWSQPHLELFASKVIPTFR